ncbi:acyl-CoA thioesterase/BAAT N-terminal domain-containing protein, partial [Candidatus Symbiopectobacterium sp. NZEC135]
MSATLRIDTPDGLIDVSRKIRADGLAPGRVRFMADFTHTDGSIWHSDAVFDVGDDGVLDLETALPLSGDWLDAEPMAPVWSLRLVSEP